MSRDAELEGINEELQGIEEEFQALLRRKRELTDRKQELQEQLDAEAIDVAEDSSSSVGRRKDPDWNDAFPWTADIHRLRQEAVSRRPGALLYMTYALLHIYCCCSLTLPASDPCKSK